jgi:KDO2-lipid IV(A) lauroyltransferase
VAEPLRRRLRARALGGLGWLGARAPRALVAPLTNGAARAALRGRHARIARENLAHAFPELDDARRAALLRATYRHAARQLREWLLLSRGAPLDAPSWIDDAVAHDASLAHLDAVLREGRGAIVVTAHLGNWELLCAALRRRGLDGAVVGRVRGEDDWLVRMRAGYGVATLPQDSPARRVLEVLRAGGVVGLLSDLEVRRLDGAFLPFFGRPALTMTAPAALARAHHASLVPVRCVATGADGGQYRLSADEPLELDRSLARREAALELCTRMNARFEHWIREAPEQWCWHQPRWRTRPGEHEPVPLVERHRINRARLARREERP